jgi:hypothetical protein
VKTKQIPKDFWKKSTNKYFKDGINNHIVHKKNTVNPKKSGTKAAFVIDTEIEAGETKTFDFRLSPHKMENAFFDFDEIFEIRKNEANEFYAEIQKDITEDEKMCNDKLLQDYFGINNFTIIMLQNG